MVYRITSYVSESDIVSGRRQRRPFVVGRPFSSWSYIACKCLTDEAVMLFGRKKRPEDDQAPVRDDSLNEALEADLAIIYKHSTRCPTSATAMRQVKEFMAKNPDIPVYVVDVIRDRALSRQLADDLGVQHQSPQVVVLKNGTLQAHGSHYEISVDRLEAWCHQVSSSCEPDQP